MSKASLSGVQDRDTNTDSHALERDTFWTQDGGYEFFGVSFHRAFELSALVENSFVNLHLTRGVPELASSDLLETFRTLRYFYKKIPEPKICC